MIFGMHTLSGKPWGERIMKLHNRQKLLVNMSTMSTTTTGVVATMNMEILLMIVNVGFRNVRVILRRFDIMIITRQRCVSGTPLECDKFEDDVSDSVAVGDSEEK